MTARSHLERVRAEGLVSGWCWDESDPDRAVQLVVLLDGEPVGVTVADIFREDLEQAGIGNGAHAFTFLLPWDRIAQKSQATIGLLDEQTNEILDATIIFRRAAVVTIEDRLREVEQQVRLLSARLEETAQRARHDAAVMGGVFATIGAFFTRLSQTAPETAPMTLVSSVASLLETTRARMAPFSLARPTAPIMTLCVDSAGTAQALYACLRAIHAAGLDTHAEIVLIDDGRSDQAALLPAVVQNLRYWRPLPGQSLLEARNTAVLPANRALVAFLSAATRVTAEWLPTMLATFARLPDCAVLGAKVVRLDDTIEASGLLPGPSGLLADLAYGEHAQTPQSDMLAPVAAIPDVALIMRGEVFAALGGFDTGFATSLGATIDLCIRCWDAGRQVFYQPAAPLGWSDEQRLAATGEAPLDQDTAAALAHRWLGRRRPAWPRPIGRALLLDGSGDDPSGVLQAALALQALGYAVTFGVPGGLENPEPRGDALRGIGVQVLRAPFQSTVAETIQSAAQSYDLIQLTLAAALALSPSEIRALSPQSRIVLALDAEAEAALSDAVSAKDLLAAIDASDGVLTQDPGATAALRRAGRDKKLLAPLSGQAERAGIWLALNPADPPARDALSWFCKSVLPAILKGLPGVSVHALGDAPDEAVAGLVWHRPDEVTTLLSRLRLAVAPIRRAGSKGAAVAASLEAGLPVIATPLAFATKTARPGLLPAAATARDIAQQVILAYGSSAEERSVANGPASVEDGEDRLAKGYRDILDALKLPFRVHADPE
jgi:O-antigen biosynthesis protein